jgi:BirA family transcriptional regulator, biotin operon repressor / biotin---[acetyl-CoA-carboxylase] ligase
MNLQAELNFPERRIGRVVRVYDEVTSTNDLAFAESAGTVIVAGQQTAGRGQHGRVWNAPQGTSLLMSVVLQPPPEFRRPVQLIAWAACAVADTVDQFTGRHSQIKWPNDILIDQRKICGILTEQKHVTVVGIGLNINQTQEDFLKMRLPQATSLACLTGSWIEPMMVMSELLKRLDAGYTHPEMLETKWKRKLGLVGGQVVVEKVDGEVLIGRLHDISFEGIEIQVDDSSTTFWNLPPESIRHLSAV